MKKWLLCLLIYGVRLTCAQENTDRWVIKKALDIPSNKAVSTDSIAAWINANFKEERQKVLAAYAWVTTNMRYSTDSANNINLGADENARINVALRRRKGVCENFAAIFNDIANKSGLTAFQVNGITNQGGSVDRSGHSWVAVLVNGKWQLADPTWDEGRVWEPRFFLLPASEFIHTHLPYDPLWQLLIYPITQLEFAAGNTIESRKTTYFNYEDSIRAYLSMDSLHKLQSVAARIQLNSVNNNNKLVKENLDYVKMHIEMIRQDKDIDLYNASVADLNEATSIFNSFIQYRNNQFLPEKSSTEVKGMLDEVAFRLDASLKKLDEIDKSPATFAIGTYPVRDRISILFLHLKEQRDFLSRYSTTAKATR